MASEIRVSPGDVRRFEVGERLVFPAPSWWWRLLQRLKRLFRPGSTLVVTAIDRERGIITLSARRHGE